MARTWSKTQFLGTQVASCLRAFFLFKMPMKNLAGEDAPRRQVW